MNSRHGSLENIILNAIWTVEKNFQENICVSNILDLINSDNEQVWAYTTIKTVMDRLVDKNILNRVKNGKKFYYTSVFSREEMGSRSIKKLAKQFYNDDLEELLKAVKKASSEVMAFV